MAISPILISKSILGIGFIGATAATGYFYRNEILDLLKRTKSDVEKIKKLGIVNCEFENLNEAKTCTLTEEQLKTVKFSDKNGNALSVTAAGNVSLKIERLAGEEAEDFTENLKITITNTEENKEIVIGEQSGEKIVLKKGISKEFKIKKVSGGLFLEGAWDLKSLAEKVGIICSGNEVEECDLSENNINVWNNSNYTFGANTTTTERKVTVAKDTKDYKEGFKFSFKADITLANGTKKTNEGAIEKLIKDNTSYEINIKGIEGGDEKWFLIEKKEVVNNTNDNSSLNTKIRALGIENCDLGNKETSKECTLDKDKFKKVKFVDKNSKDLTPAGEVNVDLKIEKVENNSEWTNGLKFTFTNKDSAKDAEIGTNGDKITLKSNTSYEFKMKEDDKLVKAWDLNSLGAKAGLSCTNDSANECSLTSGQINVWRAQDDYITKATVDDTSKKVSVEKNVSGHNEGYKFTVSDDITLKPGTQKKSSNGIEKISKESKTYEIACKIDGTTNEWFLVEKNTAK